MTADNADFTDAERAEWQAMMDSWQAALDTASRQSGRLSAGSAMLIIALDAVRAEVGNEMFALLLDGFATKVRDGKPITLKARFGVRPH